MTAHTKHYCNAQKKTTTMLLILIIHAAKAFRIGAGQVKPRPNSRSDS